MHRGVAQVSNLLKGFTPHLFVVTSEWDTQIARSVRAGRPGRVGSGFRLNSYVSDPTYGALPTPCTFPSVHC